MNTEVLTDLKPGSCEVKRCAALLKLGKIVAFPTETLYGLGVDAMDKEALEKLFELKGRSKNHPMAVQLSFIQDVHLVAFDVPDSFFKIAQAFMPGPISVILNKHPSMNDVVTGGLDTIAVRVPDCDITLDLLKEVGFPLAVPSANLTGKPPATSAQEVLDTFDGKIAAVIDGGVTSGTPSTVLDLSNPASPRILRMGAVSREAIEKVLSTSVQVPIKVELFDTVEALQVHVSDRKDGVVLSKQEASVPHLECLPLNLETLQSLKERGLETVYVHACEKTKEDIELFEHLKSLS